MTANVTPNDMANAIRSLAMDAVEKANSGHPGLPMGVADIATVLFTKVMKFDPADPWWPDRDRFVLSAGHGSMLLYSVLYLLGYEDMTIDQIKQFRQLNSKTAGHPEYHFAAGIETTTGPLGQGLGNSVGMAIAEAKLAAEFGADLVDHRTWVIAGDGCLMEGISQEAISLAGHLKLNKLCVIWDNNNITIDGAVSNADSTDQVARFKACGWNTIEIDGHESGRGREGADRGAQVRQADDDRGQDDHRLRRAEEGRARTASTARRSARKSWRRQGKARDHLSRVRGPGRDPQRLARGGHPLVECARRVGGPARRRPSPSSSAEFERRIAGKLPDAFKEAIDAAKKKWVADKPKIASRKASQNALEVINAVVPETDRRFGRPHRLEPHQHQRDPALHRRPTAPAATCATASASTRWRRR